MPQQDGADVAEPRAAVPSDRGGGQARGPNGVQLRWARRADAIIRGFFIPHAEQFYDLLDGSGSVHRVRSVATAILRCPKDEIVLRDVVRRCRVMRDKERNEQIRLMQRFETFGWLTRLDRYGTAHPRWRRTSGLGERFEEDLKREAAARAATTAVIKADASAVANRKRNSMPRTIDIITREQARRRRLKRYFTGQPCQHGHICERFVTRAWCVECVRAGLKV